MSSPSSHLRVIAASLPLALVLTLGPVSARAQDGAAGGAGSAPGEQAPDAPEEGEAPEPEDGSISAVFALKDGARIVGNVDVSTFRIDTGYGVLTVPVKDIYSVRFGKRSDPDLLARIAQLIGQLGDGDFSVRDKATAELTELGLRAEAELQAALRNSTDAEVKARAKKVIDAIAADSPDEEVLEEDEIVTVRFTVRGSLQIDRFEIDTRFGLLAVPKKHVVSIRFREPPTIRQTITLAGTASAQGTYHDTGIEIRKGDEVTIAASGTVTIGGWGMTVSPDGVPNNRFMGNLPLGCLVAKIGEGQLIQLGSTWSEKVDRRGKLELAIAAPNQNNTGKFKVEVTVRRKVK